MRNYGEEVAYWYLRLNGFFPITDWVYKSNGHHVDCDLLAYRPIHVYEEIGGKEGDWDEVNLEGIDKEPLYVIGDVKTGEDPDWKWDDDRLKQCKQRLGYINQQNQSTNTGKLIKIIFCTESNKNKPKLSKEGWIKITIEEAQKFINSKVNKYLPQKYKGRMLFPSNLFQYLIWIEKSKTS